MKTVVIGLLGTVKDAGVSANRWGRWRPTISLCQHEELLIDRFELLCEKEFEGTAAAVAADIATVSPETKVNTHIVEFDDPWNLAEVYGTLHSFAKSYPFAPEKENYLIHITTGTHVAQICLFLLTEANYFPAKLLQTSPPKRERSRSPGTYTIIDLDLSKYDQIASRFHEEHLEAASFLKSGIATRNKAFNQLIDRIEEVAVGSKEPILLMGPTGAGKSRLAHRIYDLKKARHQISGEFVELNCATLRGDTAMSTLFGHAKGAFTGAAVERQGLLREADGGLLFLDEIGELGLDEQAMLLRALEKKTFFPLGSDSEVSSEFQLIAGSNRELRQAVVEGRFREDLLARIDLWTFELPGLKSRREDIPPNLDYELEQYAKEHGRRLAFNKEARERFLEFATSPEATWNRNFRDLNGAVRRLCTLCPSGRITKEAVDEEITRLLGSWRASTDAGARLGTDADGMLERLLGERSAALDLFDRAQLCAVVSVCGESHSLADAGRKLFAVSRAEKTTSNDADRLRKYLARFGLTMQAIQDAR